MRTLTKTERRQDAQKTILACIQGVFYSEDLTQEERQELSKQMARIEKLFGYEANSWVRG